MLRPLAFCLAFLGSLSASALIESGSGNRPVADSNWPAGALAAANLTSRVGWWEGPPFGGGERHFQYRGDQKTLDEMAGVFGKINAPQLQVVIGEGRGFSQFLQMDKDAGKGAFDWELVLWNAESFHHLYNNPRSYFDAEVAEFRGELPPPRLDVYVDNGRLDVSKVRWPKNVTVHDERATANGYSPADGNVIRGTVYDLATSKPIKGAVVTVEKYSPADEKVATATTDADGNYELKQIAGGGYALVARYPGYAPRRVEYVSLGSHSFKSVVTHLSKAVDLKGKVVDSKGKPLAGVKIVTDSIIGFDGRGYTPPAEPQTSSDAAGEFVLSGLPHGYAPVFAERDGYYGVEPLKLYDVPGEVTITMIGTGTVQGRVTLPIPRVKQEINVSIASAEGSKVGSWGGGMLVTDPDGRFKFQNVPPGKYYVGTQPFIGDPAKVAGAVPVEVKSGETTEVTLK